MSKSGLEYIAPAGAGLKLQRRMDICFGVGHCRSEFNFKASFVIWSLSLMYDQALDSCQIPCFQTQSSSHTLIHVQSSYSDVPS